MDLLYVGKYLAELEPEPKEDDKVFDLEGFDELP